MDFIFNYSITVIVSSMLFALAISFPVIELLYRLNITRRMNVDFTTIIEKRNLKVGVPIMGGLIVVITVVILNFLFNPYRTDVFLQIILYIFVLSALLGGFDDILNIYGNERGKMRTLSRIFKLIRVHKSLIKRVWLITTIPWNIYRRFFFMLGSNPGKGIQAHEKILVQSIAGISLGFGVYNFLYDKSGLINIPLFNYSIDIGVLIIPFALITVLLMTNAVNLADGMDSLASNELLFSFLAYFFIALYKQELYIIFLIATVIGAIIVYTYFNIPPARFQMGDVGSLSLGTLLASVAFALGEPLLLLVISFPFVLTLLSAVIQGIGRRILGRRIFRMAPIHYHFQMYYGWSEEKVVMRFTLLSMVCSLLGLWLFFM